MRVSLLRRNNALLIVASIAASFALFACSGNREASGGTPENAANPENEAAKSATAATGPTNPNPVPAPIEAAQAPDGPAADPWAVEPPQVAQTGGTTFGNDGEILEDEAPREAKKAEPLPGTGGHTFTNKDLHRYRPLKAAFGLDDAAAKAATDAHHKDKSGASGDAEDPNKPEGEKSMTPEELQAEIDTTQAEITKAEGDLAYLKTRGPSLHNPFLPRVTPNEKDAATEDGMDNVQRLAHVDARIAETEATINKLRQKLETLSQPPVPNQ